MTYLSFKTNCFLGTPCVSLLLGSYVDEISLLDLAYETSHQYDEMKYFETSK